MKNTFLAAGALARILAIAGFFTVISAGSGIAVAETQTMTAPAIKAVEVTPVIEETLDAPQKEPAFQGLMPIVQNNAQKNDVDIITYSLDVPLGNDTHPILRITPDKSELVRLDRDAASIVIGNPDHLGVLMDNRRLLILVPRQPGATYLTVLDSAGSIIMQRHVIIASPKADYIRIRRSCTGQGSNCQETSVYYCPGMCHPVNMVTTEGGGDLAPLPGSPAQSGHGDSPAAPQAESDAPDINGQ